ncbi:MAG: FAD-dependent thymidylate synthase [Candidatus Diapherotrites archaeon]
MPYSKEDSEILLRHVTNLDKNVYALKNLPPEVVSVLFAYVSRSPASFRDNLLKLLREGELLPKGSFTEATDYFASAQQKASAFHEKWVVGFGHNSVAEHAVCNLALENVSILASKAIEDVRLAAFTEKSTRYQLFDRTKYLKPEKIMRSKHGVEYECIMNSLFDFYVDSTPKMLEFMKKKHPKPDSMNEKFYESLTKSRACDVLRYALPASTLTNIGMTANARSLEHAIIKLSSHPLEEMQSLGAQIKEECSKILPSLLKAAKKSDYIASTEERMLSFSKKYSLKAENRKEVELVVSDKNPEAKLVASIIYRYSSHSFAQCLKQAEKMPDNEKEKIIDEFTNGIGKEQPLREFEHPYFTFDILVDFGAFRDIQRHRMCTQTTQLLSTDHGYSIPQEIIECGLKKEFEKCMSSAKELFDSMRQEMPFEAQYCVPLAFKKRVLFTWNLRELWHFIKLRSSRAGHESYRKIAQQCYAELKEKHPLLAKYLSVDLS